MHAEPLCRPCTAAGLSDPLDPLPQEAVHPLVDPTLCADCRLDNGAKALPTLSGLPLCRTCLRHRWRVRFPWSMRLAVAACLLAGSCAIPDSFHRALAVKAKVEGVRAFREDRAEEAAAYLDEAVSHLPTQELEDLRAYYHGRVELEYDHPEEALTWFERSLTFDPSSTATQRMLIVSRRLIAFKHKRYDDYLKASEALVAFDDRSPSSLLALAPAWACRFALNGDPADRERALSCLAEARKRGRLDEDDWMREGWVRHMIEKRTILSLIEYRYLVGKGGVSAEDFG